MKTRPRILIAGSTGYLGSHIVKQLITENVEFKAIARNKPKLLSLGARDDQVIEAQVTEPEELHAICDEVDVVISCLGITRQRDGLGYMDVDYQANLNLLQEAERAGVSKFIYVSAFNAEKYPSVRLLKAKERFALRLLGSENLTPCVIRPNGFFSDLEEVYQMAKAGRVYLFGAGDVKMNPIHGEDLANFCLEAIDRDERELDVGGPEVLSGKDIAKLAFLAQNKPEQITCLPDWLRGLILSVVKRLPEKWGGPAEFFLTVMGKDAIAPRHGTNRLGDYFTKAVS
ncbi:SDR family oxidoreductase [Photobacterium indicum]|uniref:NAD-dependent dehydratase n=1 Tax=Photobacterium indicum TaxID=81447 RepID=A0A2T3L777_9GAMM|nr:SDR family oxidoreductase [Photobacterium indicum]PSV46229.1 NAD-dependent dehydratase [Photobacterium indicum]